MQRQRFTAPGLLPKATVNEINTRVLPVLQFTSFDRTEVLWGETHQAFFTCYAAIKQALRFLLGFRLKPDKTQSREQKKPR